MQQVSWLDYYLIVRLSSNPGTRSLPYRDDSINHHLNNRQQHDSGSLRNALGRAHWLHGQCFWVERRADHSLAVTLRMSADFETPMLRTIPDGPAEATASASIVHVNPARTADKNQSVLGICAAHLPGHSDTPYGRPGIPRILSGPPAGTDLPRGEGFVIPPPTVPYFRGYHPYAIPEVLITGSERQAPPRSSDWYPPYTGMYPNASSSAVPLLRYDPVFPLTYPDNFLGPNCSSYSGGVNGANNGYAPSLSSRTDGVLPSAMPPRDDIGALYDACQMMGGASFQVPPYN